MRKIIYTAVMAVLVSIGLAVPAGSAEPSEVAAVADCIGSITPGTGVATTNGHCILLAYKYADGAPGPNKLYTSLPQPLFGQVTGGPGTLNVTVPDCFWQVDLVDDFAVIANPLNAPDYYSTNGWLVDYDHGGTKVCSTSTTTTSTTTAPSTTVPTTSTVPKSTTSTVPPVTVVTPPPAEVTEATPRFTG